MTLIFLIIYLLHKSLNLLKIFNNIFLLINNKNVSGLTNNIRYCDKITIIIIIINL